MSTVYAKDPIDFIRNFRFAVFHSNPGSSAGPTRVDTKLSIRIYDTIELGVTEVHIEPTNHHAAAHVANWLERQTEFIVMPFAEVLSGTNVVTITVKVTGDEIRTGMIRTHLDKLINHVAMVMAEVKSGYVRIIAPSYEPKQEQPGYNNRGGGGNFGGAQTIGRTVPDNGRLPAGGISRAPQINNGGYNNEF